MKKSFWIKVSLVIVPTALIATPLLTFAISNKNFSNDKQSDANYEQEIKQIIHNQNLSLQEKIKQLQDKLKTLENHTLDILKNLQAELDNLKHLKECQAYLTKLNWETSLSDKLPSEFSKQKNQNFDLSILKLKINPKFTNVDFEYKLIKIDDNEGTLTIEINLKYQLKYMSTIQQTIRGFKNIFQASNHHFKNMSGFLSGLQNVKNENTVGLFPKEDKISALIDEIYDIFPNSKNYLTLKVTNANTKISDFIDKDTNIIKLSFQLSDNKNQKTQQFKNVNFKITNHTIYLNSNNQKQITFDHDLSEINTKEIIKIGFYQESENVIRAVKMPKIIEKVPNKLPSEITSLQNMFKECKNFNQDLSSWDTSNVTNISWMFTDAKAFNQDISNWNINNVITTKRMFSGAIIFNQDISKWNTSNVIDMDSMFAYTDNFNQNISKWNTSNVKNMHNMFFKANVFNQDISKWNTSNVTNMKDMFKNAWAFNQDLSRWNVDKVTNYDDFATNSGFENEPNKWPIKFKRKENYLL